MNKRMVKAGKYEYLSGYDLSGKISDVVKRLKDLQKEHGPDATLEFTSWVEYDNAQARFDVMRPETDKECQEREAQSQKQAAEYKERRRREYESLKKEFE